MPVNLELHISDETYDAFKDLLATNNASLVQQVSYLEAEIEKELDIHKINNIKTYITKCLLQLALISNILGNMPERPKRSNLILPNGNT